MRYIFLLFCALRFNFRLSFRFQCKNSFKKTVISLQIFFQVIDVEPVLSLLNDQDPYDASTWETRYMLLLWMSIIVIIPFHMHRLDDTTENKPDKKPIMERYFKSFNNKS